MAGIEGRRQPATCVTYGDDEERFWAAYKDNRSILLHTLHSSECVSHMVSSIDEFDNAFTKEVRRKDRNEGQRAANECFLEKFEQSNSPGKTRVFMDVLDDLGYEMLCKLLRGQPVNKDQSRYLQLVAILAPLIQKSIDPLQLLPHLETTGCLNRRDVENIQQETRNNGNMDGALLLLSRVTRLSDNWFHDLMTAFYHNKMLNLMNEVDPDYAKKIIDQVEKRTTWGSQSRDAQATSHETMEVHPEMASKSSDETSVKEITRFTGGTSTGDTSTGGTYSNDQLVSLNTSRAYSDCFTSGINLLMNNLNIRPDRPTSPDSEVDGVVVTAGAQRDSDVQGIKDDLFDALCKCGNLALTVFGEEAEVDVTPLRRGISSVFHQLVNKED